MKTYSNSNQNRFAQTCGQAKCEMDPSCTVCEPIKLVGDDSLFIKPSPDAQDCPYMKKLVTTNFCTYSEMIKTYLGRRT